MPLRAFRRRLVGGASPRRRTALAAALVAPVAALAACAGDDGPMAATATTQAAMATPVIAAATAESVDDAEGAAGDPDAGEALFVAEGCSSCHSTTGARLAGPTLQGGAGSEVPLDDGTTATADRAYLTESIADPTAEVVDGFQPLMPSFELDETEIADLVAYIEEIG